MRDPARSLAAFLAAGTMLAGVSALAQETARGTVFEDLNADGVRDDGEPGIADVRVSNGRDVVLTDADGRYELAADGETIIFITKPSGYATPVNAQMLPQFYYIHDPDGSPLNLRYPGLEPTGPLPEAIDFPLRRQNEPARFEAILFADTQPQTAEEVDYIRDDVVAELIGTDASFGMTLGDIMFDDLSLLPRYNSVIAQIGIPWYNVPGNHELNFLAAGDEQSLETFKRIFGPTYYSFEYADAYFVVFDNVNYFGEDVGREEPTHRGNGLYEGRISEAQLEWLRNDLQYVPQDKVVFLTMHIPLEWTLDPERASVNTVNREELFTLLEGYEHVYAFAGHTHTTEHSYFDADDGFNAPAPLHHHIIATVSGAWWSGPIDDRGIPVSVQRDGTPNGYHVLEVDGSDVAVRYKAAGMPEDYQMRIMLDVAYHGYRIEGLRDFRPGELLDGRLTLDEVPATDLVVNFFAAGPNSIVEYVIGDGPPVRMENVRTFDPYANELFLRNEDTRKPWVWRDNEPFDSTHIYKADLPDTLEPGFYTVTVRATDEYGRTHHGHRVLEIVGNGAPAMTSDDTVQFVN